MSLGNKDSRDLARLDRRAQTIAVMDFGIEWKSAREKNASA